MKLSAIGLIFVSMLCLALAKSYPDDPRPRFGKSGKQRSLKKLQSHHSFKEFVIKHGKEYNTLEEYQKRFEIFKDNMKKVQLLRDTEQGTGEYGPTMFSDLTENEFIEQNLGFYPPKYNPVSNVYESELLEAEPSNVDIPESFDWRDHGAVTPVKNQGQCGSCWAFSTTGNIEGLWKIKHGNLLSLSEQELVDCDKVDHGCNGGLPENAYKQIMKIGGLESEKDYKYDAKDETCHFDKSKVQATVSGGVKISTNETEMAQWLFKNGPISIGLNAAAMQFYKGGVSHPLKFLCPANGINHGVLVVGFGVHRYPLFHRVMPFWIVKNSWGPLWGEQGYYRVYRGDGTCGLNQMATSAVVN